jgi:penicillin-binding protein 2
LPSTGGRTYASWLTPPRVAAVISGVVFVVLVVFLFKYQIIEGAQFEVESRKNYVIKVPLKAARGEIVDSDGVVLAGSRQSFSICAVPKTTLKNRDEIALLAKLLAVDEEFIVGKLSKTASSYRPAVVLRDVDFATLSAVEEMSAHLSDILVVAEPVRSYPAGEWFCHILGYVGEVTQDEVKNNSTRYASGDLIGRSGVEKSYDDVLSGTEGYKLVRVSMDGDEVPIDYEDVPSVPPEPGKRVKLCAHSELQMLADSLLAGRRGCAIVLGVKTGEVLALSSNPVFDPTLFATGISAADWRNIIEDADKPMLNRAIQCAYPPGSTYKIVTAGVGLEKRLVLESTRYKPCPGSYRFGRRVFKCWKEEGHGSANLVRAITVSCDVYFYQLGERMDLEDFYSYGTLWDLPNLTHIDLPNEVKGLVPNAEWYDRAYGKGKWTKGIMLNIVIGQGEVLTTPLSMLCFICGVANDGKYPVPHCVKSIGNDGDETEMTPQLIDMPLSDTTLGTLRKAMRNVVEGDEGTGRAARVEGVEVAGKTGTAQNPHGDDHAWFVCYAPCDDPEIGVCVMVENAGHGGSVAAPIAGRLLRHYFAAKGDELVAQR